MRIKDVVVDCRHAASLDRFWTSILDGYAIAPYDEAELDRLAQQGITSTEDDPTVRVEACAWSFAPVLPSRSRAQEGEEPVARRPTGRRSRCWVVIDH